MSQCTSPEKVHGFSMSGRFQKHLLEPLCNTLYTGKITEKIHVELCLQRLDPFEFLGNFLGAQSVYDTGL